MKSILCGCVGLLALASTLAAQGSASAPLRAQIPWPFFVGTSRCPPAIIVSCHRIKP